MVTYEFERIDGQVVDLGASAANEWNTGYVTVQIVGESNRDTILRNVNVPPVLDVYFRKMTEKCSFAFLNVSTNGKAGPIFLIGIKPNGDRVHIDSESAAQSLKAIRTINKAIFFKFFAISAMLSFAIIGFPFAIWSGYKLLTLDRLISKDEIAEQLKSIGWSAA